MKLLLTALYFSYSLFAARAVILVLETPLRRNPNSNSKIVQLVRRGEIIKIHDRHVHAPVDSIEYEIQSLEYKDNEIKNTESKFIETIDNKGLSAYILRKHVKIIYADKREEKTAIKPFKHDPTDYRLEEPLSENFPFVHANLYRAGITLSLGPNLKNNYYYNSTITKEDFSQRVGISINYLKKVSFDPYDRFYFGFKGNFYSQSAAFDLTGNRDAKESHRQLSLGPQITYDTFKSEDYRIGFFGHMSLNFNGATIQQNDNSLGITETRKFSNISITPELGGYFQFRDVFPKTNIQLGTSMQFHYAHELKASNNVQYTSLWNVDSDGEDTIKYPLGAHYFLYLSFQSYY